MMKQSETSTQIRRKINMLFDNALDQHEAVNLLQKVDSDPKYSSFYQKEKDFREFVKTNIVRPGVSSNLIENIKNSLPK